jgi:hypothetical protein
MKPLLIGLSGKSGSGKSTAANYLTDRHGYHQFAFADALKDIVELAFGFSDEQLYGALKDKVDSHWGVAPRWCLQWLGTEIFRSRFPDIWIRRLRRDIMNFLSINGQRPIVVTDVRFRDEAEALKRLGAVLVRIERTRGAPEPGIHPLPFGTTYHPSEIDLDGWEGWRAGRGNHVLRNDGSLKKLYSGLNEVLALHTDKAELARATG